MSTVPPVTAGPRTAVALFTSDLRVHDHLASAGAVEQGRRVLPLTALDDDTHDR
jgi:deoxyribodipyrimidine photolyase